MAAIDFKTMA